jgi:hypothetical protein
MFDARGSAALPNSVMSSRSSKKSRSILMLISMDIDIDIIGGDGAGLGGLVPVPVLGGADGESVGGVDGGFDGAADGAPETIGHKSCLGGWRSL